MSGSDSEPVTLPQFQKLTAKPLLGLRKSSTSQSHSLQSHDGASKLVLKANESGNSDSGDMEKTKVLPGIYLAHELDDVVGSEIYEPDHSLTSRKHNPLVAVICRPLQEPREDYELFTGTYYAVKIIRKVSNRKGSLYEVYFGDAHVETVCTTSFLHLCSKINKQAFSTSLLRHMYTIVLLSVRFKNRMSYYTSLTPL
jgi:hypothetical protein